MELDDYALEPDVDGSARAKFITTGLHPTLVGLKTKILVGLGAPLQRTPEIQVTEVQKGLLATRFKVNAKIVPLIGRP